MEAKQWLIIAGICLPAIITYAELIERKKIKFILIGIVLSMLAALGTFFGFETVVNIGINLFLIAIFSRIIIQTVSVHKMTIFNAVCAVATIIFLESYPRALGYVEALETITDEEKVLYHFFIMVFVYFIPIINIGLISLTKNSAMEYLASQKEEEKSKEPEKKTTNEEEKVDKEDKPKTKHKAHKKKKKSKKKK